MAQHFNQKELEQLLGIYIFIFIYPDASAKTYGVKGSVTSYLPLSFVGTAGALVIMTI